MNTVEFDTEVIAVNPLKLDLNKIKIAANWIQKGEVIAFPTETVYGLGADATNSDAVKKIYVVKKRPADNPLISHFASINNLEGYITHLPELAYDLANQFWPGPLTLVLNKTDKISPLVTQGLDTIAVRIPAHPVALALIREANVPIAAPSANLSGRPSPTQASHVLNDLKGAIPLILDGGSTAVGVESTVINLTSEIPTLLRPGGITIEELRKTLPNLQIPDQTENTEQPISPGMKYTHYSPNTELVLLEDDMLDDTVIDHYAESLQQKTLILCTHEDHKHQHDTIVVGRSVSEIQINFFASLRMLDAGSYELGLFEAVETINEGYTVMNRIRKAAHRVIKSI